jgi:hypothetical protein
MPTRNKHQETKKPRTKPSARELLRDPETLTISVMQAAEILGISRSTASHQYRKTGYVIEGVRVLRSGKRCVVSTYELREALGIPHPSEA